ncbi:MAG: DUF4230 domain-containing protein [Ginsengibacter sp.]
MRKSLFKYSLIVAVILLAIFLFQKINWLPSFNNIFKSQPVVIEETPIIIKQINTLAQLVTVTYTDEVVMDQAKTGNGIPSIVSAGIGMMMLPPTDRLVMIGRGKVLAGIDLKNITSADVKTTEDSIHLTLPHATILNTIINPSGFETFDEKGSWSETEVIALKLKLKNELTQRAIQQNILRQAEKRSKNIIETFLKAEGFKKVDISLNN